MHPSPFFGLPRREDCRLLVLRSHPGIGVGYYGSFPTAGLFEEFLLPSQTALLGPGFPTGEGSGSIGEAGGEVAAVSLFYQIPLDGIKQKMTSLSQTIIWININKN